VFYLRNVIIEGRKDILQYILLKTLKIRVQNFWLLVFLV